MPRFVILEHDWNGVHWDLMFEVEGTLVTWAIDEPLVPGTELPARKLADHRLVYLDYQGPVSGHRGVVTRVDEGTYRVETWTTEHVCVALRGRQAVGRLELRKSETRGNALSLGTWFLRLGKVD